MYYSCNLVLYLVYTYPKICLIIVGLFSVVMLTLNRIRAIERENYDEDVN